MFLLSVDHYFTTKQNHEDTILMYVLNTYTKHFSHEFGHSFVC